MKYVTLGQLTSGNLRVIKEGIGADDRVIVNGLMRARPGTKVHAAGAGREAGRAGAGEARRNSQSSGGANACAFRTSSSIGRSSPPSSRSCS